MMCFFNRYFPDIPTMDDVGLVTYKDVTHIFRVGALGIKEEKWPFIGELKKFKLEEWPVPLFFRIDSVHGFVTIVEFDDVDPMKRFREQRVDSSFNIEGLPLDSLAGAEAIEIKLALFFQNHGPIIPLWRRWKFNRSVLK
ncbi:hypothetical protein YWS52_30000 [Chitiniphilus shinanonensis]